MTGRRDGKMEGVDEGKEGGSAAAAAAALCETAKAQLYTSRYKLDMELKLVWGTACRKPKIVYNRII